MEVIRSGKALGAEIKGIDLSQNLSQDEIDGINKAWDENLVLVFKNQNINDEEQVRFTRYFGEIEASGKKSNITIKSNANLANNLLEKEKI